MSYCERCEKEYPGLTCPACGQPMLQEVVPEDMDPESGDWRFGVHTGDELPWPTGPDGGPEPALLLTNCPDFLSYGTLTITKLQANGIPVLTRYPKAGWACKFYTGVSGSGIELLVPASQLEQAKKLLPPADPAGTAE